MIDEFFCNKCKVNKRNKFKEKRRYFKLSEVKNEIDFNHFDKEIKKICKNKKCDYHISKHIKGKPNPKIKHVLYFCREGKTKGWIEMYGKYKEKLDNL